MFSFLSCMDACTRVFAYAIGMGEYAFSLPCQRAFGPYQRMHL